ncbi:MAG: LysR substrate-binding domain-containing protein [Bacteroidales bacterium]|nr:LysR substrate-binding domain-containing protein [Bacteroidales bacterium]
MTLQQLRYIVAIDRFRNFAKAADACDISQPTLSAMLIKLEEELDVRIFERTNKSVKPTTEGEKIILQAQKALMEAGRITEIVNEGKGAIGGTLALSVGPTIAPYLLPKFIKHYRAAYPSVSLSIMEMKANFMHEAILRGEIDAGIATCDNAQKGILEVPLYTEKFYVYLSESFELQNQVLQPEDMDNENMWIMKEAQCLRDSAFSFCKARTKGQYIYEAGSIETLIRIVDENGGYTIIPEMHLPFLTEAQRSNVREIDGNHVSERRISLYIKDDYIRERMLNTITDTLKAFMPKGMLTDSIIKYGIKL